MLTLLICSHLLAVTFGGFLAWLYFCFAAHQERQFYEETLDSVTRAAMERMAKSACAEDHPHCN